MRNVKLEIPVRVVVKQTEPGLEFDLIDAQNYIKTFKLDAYQRRQYRASDRDLIQQLIEDYVNETVPDGTDYRLIIRFM